MGLLETHGGLAGADDAWEVPGTMVLGCGGGGD